MWGDQAEWHGKLKYIHAHVLICSASLCLLVGAFNPFIFKVIIYMYDPITIFLIALGLFCVGLFLLQNFLATEVPLAFIVKLVWWCWILWTFACLDSFWFLHQILNKSLAEWSILGFSFFPFITLSISCHSLVEFLL